jgi:hypothetical protein
MTAQDFLDFQDLEANQTKMRFLLARRFFYFVLLPGIIFLLIMAFFLACFAAYIYLKLSTRVTITTATVLDCSSRNVSGCENFVPTNGSFLYHTNITSTILVQDTKAWIKYGAGGWGSYSFFYIIYLCLITFGAFLTPSSEKLSEANIDYGRINKENLNKFLLVMILVPIIIILCAVIIALITCAILILLGGGGDDCNCNAPSSNSCNTNCNAISCSACNSCGNCDLNFAICNCCQSSGNNDICSLLECCCLWGCNNPAGGNQWGSYDFIYCFYFSCYWYDSSSVNEMKRKKTKKVQKQVAQQPIELPSVQQIVVVEENHKNVQ